MSGFSFKSDAYGYMLYFRDRPLGGAGTLRREPKHWQHRRADVKMFAEQARREISELEAGRGQARFREIVEHAS